MLIEILSDVTDRHRRQKLHYELVHILLSSVFAVLSGADSYRNIHSFIEVHYEFLKDSFVLNWKKIPAYTTVRNIINGPPFDSFEDAFRKCSQNLVKNTDGIFRQTE